MAIAAGEGDSALPNHPKSIRMAVIASVTFNVVIGSIFGSPGVLLKPMSEHLGVSPELIPLASLAVILSSAVFAPMIGSIAVKQPLSKMVGGAAIMLAAAWLILAVTKSYAVYLGVYALLLGPVMALGGSIVPPTLVTRDRALIHAFRKEHGNIIVKPLYGNGGAGVFFIEEGSHNLVSLLELFEQAFREPSVVRRVTSAVQPS